MLKRKCIVLLALLLMPVLFLSGCKKQIFKEKQDPFEQQTVTLNDMKPDVIYAKSGTKFFVPYMPNGTASGKATAPSPARMFWMGQNAQSVPTIYKGDTLVVMSENLSRSNVILERLKDCGYSIGIYGAEYNKDTEMIEFDYSKSIIPSSSAEEAFSSWSAEIHIKTINGKAVTENMLDSAGVLNCFEHGKSYNMEFYSGSQFLECEVYAGVHMLESWEMYVLDNITATKRGYLSITLPQDLKSGWYLVEGQGIVRYIAHERGEADDVEAEDLNQNYYESDSARYSVYSQIFTLNFAKETYRPTIYISYSRGESGTNEPAQAILVAPDGTEYSFTESNNLIDYQKPKQGERMTCSIERAMAGKWMLYISPKTLQISDVSVEANELGEAPTIEEMTVELPEERRNVTFYVRYTTENKENNKKVFGYFIYPNGETYDLVNRDDIGELSFTTSYIPAGTYIFRVMHGSDGEVTSERVSIRSSDSLESDIISVTK